MKKIVFQLLLIICISCSPKNNHNLFEEFDTSSKLSAFNLSETVYQSNLEIYHAFSETLDYQWNHQIFKSLWHYEKGKTEKHIKNLIRDMPEQINHKFEIPRDGVLFKKDSSKTSIKLQKYIKNCVVKLYNNKTGKLIFQNNVVDKIALNDIIILNKKHTFMGFKTQRESAYSYSQSWITDYKTSSKKYYDGYYEYSEIFNNELKIKIYIFCVHPDLEHLKKI